MSLRSDLRAFRRLDGSAQRIVTVAAVLLPVVSLAVKAGGTMRVLRFIESRPVARRSGAVRPAEFARLVGAVARRHVTPATCLARSLLLHGLLRRRGVTSQLRIGVTTRGKELLAHAWVEVDGEPIDDATAASRQFLPFAVAIAASPRE